MKRILLYFFLISINLIYSQNWITSTTAQSNIINEVSVINDDIVWIMDQLNTNGFSISTDGGMTWTHKNFPALFTDNNFNTGVLSAVDENTAYIIVSVADNPNLVGLYKTTDAGNSWNKENSIFNSGSSFPNQVHFWDANHGFAMGDGLELHVYIDGFWYNQSVNLSSVSTWSLNSSYYLKIVGNSAYFLTGSGTIIKTPDMGISWTEIITPFNSQANLNFAFKDDLNGILVFNDNVNDNIAYSTVDGGQTWSLINSSIANLYNNIYYVPSLGNYISTSTNGNGALGLSYSADNGISWTPDNQLSNVYIGEIEPSANGNVFVGGNPNMYFQVLAPANNLIENTTLINSFPFTDNDVRLDLATASGINDPSGCPNGNFNGVYYKFTAEESSQFDVFLEDTNNEPTGQAFIMIFTASNLNVSDESELSLVSACGFSSSVYMDLVQGTNYYIQVHRAQANALSNIIFVETPVLPVPASERDALIALYNSTNGDNWNDNTNWNSTEFVANWNGIKTTNIDGIGHVLEISLGSNNLTGNIPMEIGDFPELTSLYLWSNQLTGNIPPEIGNLIKLVNLDLSPNTFSGTIPSEIGNLINLEVLWLNQNGLSGSIPTSFQNLSKLRELHLRGSVDSGSEWSSSSFSGNIPDLTALPLQVLDLKNNFFQFQDIADEFSTYQANIPDFTFNPQYTIDAPIEDNPAIGSNITLTLTDVPSTAKVIKLKQSLVSNTYQWYKDDVALTVNANSDTYVITNAQSSDSGIYYCEITNTDVPGMIIKRQNITLNVGTLGIDDVSENHFIIYPNPTENLLNIKLNNPTKTEASLYDISGRLILKQKLSNQLSIINLENLNSGMYLLKIKTDNKITTKRIVKK